jgi:hypothetical protein
MRFPVGLGAVHLNEYQSGAGHESYGGAGLQPCEAAVFRSGITQRNRGTEKNNREQMIVLLSFVSVPSFLCVDPVFSVVSVSSVTDRASAPARSRPC